MHKNLDSKGRLRNVNIGFRMSSAESNDLNTRVSLSGLTKQDFIISKLSDRSVIVVGNPRVYKALRNQMAQIMSELERIHQASEVADELLSTIQLVALTLNGLKEEVTQ